MKLKSKSKYYIGDTLQTLRRELDNFIIDVYDDLRMLEPTIVDSLPKPTKEYRGKIIVLSGSPDVIYACLFNGTDYEWVPYYSDVVRTSTDQTISGHKTFSSGITVTPIERAAIKISANQTTTSGIETIVNFDTVDIDTANGFNATTYKYTVQNSGLFLIIARVLFLYGDGDNVRVRLYVNDVLTATDHGTWQGCVTYCNMFTAGDVLHITATQYSGADMYIDSLAYNTRWDIVRIC